MSRIKIVTGFPRLSYNLVENQISIYSLPQDKSGPQGTVKPICDPVFWRPIHFSCRDSPQQRPREPGQGSLSVVSTQEDA